MLKNLGLKTFILAIGVAFLASISWAQDNSGARVITITYDPAGDPEHPDTGPFIFDPYLLEVERGANQVPIRLQIVSEGFVFADDVRKAFWVVPDDGNITVRSIGEGNKTLMLRDSNRIAQEYKYGVVIVDENTGQEYVIDPRIKNGGGGNF